MRQDSKPDSSLDVPVMEKTLSEAQLDVLPQSPHLSKAMDWNHTDTLRTALFTKALEPSSPAHYATSVSSRLTKTSRASRTTERSFGSTDLQQMSVLMLSSDSEDDMADDSSVPPLVATKSPLSTVVTRPSPQLGSSLPKLPGKSTRSEKRSSRSSKSSKSSKRASFAPSETYITIPRSYDRTQASVLDSRSSTPSGNVSQTTNGTLSRRTSTMSTYSGKSAMTWQSKSACSIQEARAVTMVTAHCPSESDLEENEGPPVLQLTQFDHSVFNRDSSSSSAEQLTPPLSPTSVDFYIRSAHSSIDGAGSHNRLMAVTLREEMLLAALRLKQNFVRSSALTELKEGIEEEEVEGKSMDGESRSPKRRSWGNRSSKASQATVTDSRFDFGFPAPPTFIRDSNSSSPKPESPRARSSSRQSSGGRRPSSTVLVNDNAPSVCNDHSLAPPESILGKSSYDSTAEQSHEEVPVYLDTDPSPGASDFQEWEDAMSLPSDFDAMAWPTPQTNRSGSRRSSVRSTSGSNTSMQSDTLSRSNGGRLAGVVEETSADIEEEQDIPRPDSPISPDSFPAVPEKRTKLNKTARLSAVGPGLLDGLSGTELGWWGDDD